MVCVYIYNNSEFIFKEIYIWSNIFKIYLIFRNLYLTLFKNDI